MHDDWGDLVLIMVINELMELGMAMGRYGSGFALTRPDPLETRPPKKTCLLSCPVCFNGYPFNPPRRVPDPIQFFFFGT
jgi:hypothetical protein